MFVLLLKIVYLCPSKNETRCYGDNGCGRVGVAAGDGRDDKVGGAADSAVRVANLEAELAEARESNLTASAGRAFGPGSEDSRKARERLNGMIREVDACIALLRS